MLNSRTPPASIAMAKIWHARLGHITDRTLNELDTEGVTVRGDCSHGRCDACSRGKFKRKISRVQAPRPAKLFDEISVDLVHFTYVALNEERWLTLVTDGKSLFRHEFTHSAKSDAGKLLVNHLVRIENQTGRRIKRVRSELIGSVNLVFVVQLVGFRRLRFGLGHVSGWFGSKTSVSIGNQYPMR